MADPITRLNAALEGRYAIEGELGEGGMATVYLADDLKHSRKVALKVLKPDLAAVVGAERFLAEIETTANLTHPHILPLFDSGEADGFLFYVMPYLEGETLRDRIDREKQLPVGEAVRIATAVANALDHAHRNKVIHRDIKPANILLQDGEPVVSDFGIALALGVAGGTRLTETGLSVGTPYYMSPEQATGDQAVGASTDTYALGSVLYEMLVGDPPFAGSTAQAVLGKIIAGKSVSVREERPSIPANVDAAVRKALEKLPADRFSSAQDFARALGDEHFRYGELATADTSLVGPWTRLTLAGWSVAAVLAITLGWALLRPEPPAQVSRLETSVQDGLEIAPGGGVILSISPDGSRIVFVGVSDGVRQLWQRPLSQLTAVPIPGTENARDPRFSPDGQSIVYHALSSAGAVNGGLHTVSLAGAPPQTILADSVWGSQAWGPDGWIYFEKFNLGIWRVTEDGGQQEEVTVVEAAGERHEYLDVLPDGNGILYTRTSGTGGDEVAVVSLSTGESRALFEGRVARYAPSGHIVYASPEGRLSVAPFDAARLEVTGPRRTREESTFENRQFALSQSGVLVYLPGGELTSVNSRELVWVTRSGGATPVDPDWQFNLPTSGGYGWSLSPEGSRVALTHEVQGNVDIWIKHLPDGPFERLTSADQIEREPVWTPDGQSVIYLSGGVGAGGATDVWRRRADGTGTPERLLEDPRNLRQPRWVAEGEWLVLRTGEGDIVGLRPGVDSAAVSLVAEAGFGEFSPALSPDGRWLAYNSNRTGRHEVYVSPFPEVGSGRVLVSTEGGFGPLWSHSGDELFFSFASGGDRRMMVARVETDREFRVLDRGTLFSLGLEYVSSRTNQSYDVSPDDQRFLMARRSGLTAGGEDSGPLRFVVVQNFFEELNEVAPN